ncbi:MULTISPECIES: dehydrogenase [unclassified Paenibacillus]|uniref:dehydrogenase n=1 Tax=unclassified Paenibacillus TaxID=185978 RepID=UPI00384FBB66
MPPGKIPKHNNPQSRLPTARGIRRACSKELYRTCKRLPLHIAPELVKQGEELYCRKIAGHLIWIAENHSNRRLLCDWWDEDVSEELAALWKVDRAVLCTAFRSAYGG